MTYGQVAAKVASNKEKRPELYCPAKKCLWRTGCGYCPRHAEQEFRKAFTPNRFGEYA